MCAADTKHARLLIATLQYLLDFLQFEQYVQAASGTAPALPTWLIDIPPFMHRQQIDDGGVVYASADLPCMSLTTTLKRLRRQRSGVVPATMPCTTVQMGTSFTHTRSSPISQGEPGFAQHLCVNLGTKCSLLSTWNFQQVSTLLVNGQQQKTTHVLQNLPYATRIMDPCGMPTLAKANAIAHTHMASLHAEDALENFHGLDPFSRYRLPKYLS